MKLNEIMNNIDKVAVCSRSFSRNPILRDELLERYENVTFNDEGASLERESLVEFLRGHDKAITALEKIDEYVLANLPELKVVSKYGVGLDMIDMEAMRRNGKQLGWKGGKPSFCLRIGHIICNCHASSRNCCKPGSSYWNMETAYGWTTFW